MCQVRENYRRLSTLREPHASALRATVRIA